MTRHQVAVVGAGPAGSAVAYRLARQGFDVALLDRSEFPRDKTCGDGLTPRAVRALEELDVADEVARRAFRCEAITLRASEAIEFSIRLEGLGGLPDRLLVIERFVLDDLLRRHAVAAGARFQPRAGVRQVARAQNGEVRLRLDNGGELACQLAVLATGANAVLLRDVGIARPSPTSTAARCYFENVTGLDPAIVLFFDGIELPGYAWVFPTSATTANVGCGAFFDSPTPQPLGLRRLLDDHPYLRRVLAGGVQVGPIKGYPLRTDFSPAHAGADRVLVLGEAAGLVNPITGEGIDYALESATFAAEAIREGWTAAGPTSEIVARYRKALSRRFRRSFLLGHTAQRIYFRDVLLERLLGRTSHSAYLQRAIVSACFGALDPVSMFTPRTLWEVFRPGVHRRTQTVSSTD
jgi:menaquinone-9 beta-reductase